VRRRLLHSSQKPFESRLFRVPRSRMKRDVFRQQAIIVSTSGMLSGGPALTYLRELASNPANLLAFVGYQAEGTLGRRLLDGEREVVIGPWNIRKPKSGEEAEGISAEQEEGAGKKIKIEMRIEKFDMSAHSDQAGLVQFARTTKELRRIFLIHGEEKKFGELAEALRRYEVIIPKNGERYRA